MGNAQLFVAKCAEDLAVGALNQQEHAGVIYLYSAATQNAHQPCVCELCVLVQRAQGMFSTERETERDREERWYSTSTVARTDFRLVPYLAVCQLQPRKQSLQRVAMDSIVVEELRWPSVEQ